MHTPRWLFTALLCCLLGCASRSGPSSTPATPTTKLAAEKLSLVASSFPPFVDSADNPRVAIDLVTTALARAGYIADTEVTSLDDVISGLREGRYAGSSALWRSEEREQFLLYSQPYLENRLLLVARKGTEVGAQHLGELMGKKVGIVEGYAYGPELEQAKEPVFVRGPSTEDNLRALLRGELDYVLADALLIHHIAHQHPEQTAAKLALGEHTLLTRSLHLTLRKDLPNASTILQRFNEALRQMLHDGSYHEALRVDWIHADVDGDGVLEMVASGDEVGAEPPRTGYRVTTLPGSGGPSSDQHPSNARFVVKGVPYGSWDQIPPEYKRNPASPMGSNPGTLRTSIFEF
ncbi:MAG: transporter substrate-binding domain-containing protein [Myxococcales bacterium]